MTKGSPARRPAPVVVLGLLALLCSGRSRAEAQTWELTIASWNLLNLSRSKVGLEPGPLRVGLLDRYAEILSRYDIVIVQELLNDGSPLTAAIAARPAMANYDCRTVSQPSGRIGRQERYGLCYVRRPDLAMTGVVDLVGTNATAVNGTVQAAQNVWMRPPLRARFTFTKPDGTPFSFTLTTSHTKPAYGTGRPPGTPAGAPNNQSVRNELTGIEINPDASTHQLILGDLNADCASYPARDRGANFQAGWTWRIDYGEKTNTAASSNCAYDRLILDGPLNAVYRGHGIYSQKIDTRVDGKRVSDHFLVWVRIGETKKRALVAATSSPVARNTKRAFISQSAGGPPLLANGTNLVVPPGARPQLFIVKHSPSAYYDGNQTYPLVDVRGGPTPVRVTAAGTLESDVRWAAPRKGTYKLILDVNSDAKYRKRDGDLANPDDEIDLVVVDATTGHNDLVTLGDDGEVRETFDSDQAKNVYALAKALPPSASVDAYVVSMKLLPPDFPGWAEARRRGTLDLPAISIPVRRTHGPLLVPEVPPADKRWTLRTSAEGTLFASVWPSPSVLLNTRALAAPPPVPDYRPEYATDNPATVADISNDPCRDAWRSEDANFRAVCNVGNLFTDFYGTGFNVVLDIDRNGRFNDGDKVDDHDLGDIESYFRRNPGRPSLDSAADGDPAVGELKEFLNARLSLLPPLTESNVFDARTREASMRYLCSPSLPRGAMPLLRREAQQGFEALDARTYLYRRTLAGGLSAYADIDLDDSRLLDGASHCMSAQEALLDDLVVGVGARATLQADNVTIGGDVTAGSGSLFCIMAESSLTIAAGSAGLTFAVPNPATAAGTLVFGAFGLANGAACALGY